MLFTAGKRVCLWTRFRIFLVFNLSEITVSLHHSLVIDSVFLRTKLFSFASRFFGANNRYLKTISQDIRDIVRSFMINVRQRCQLQYDFGEVVTRNSFGCGKQIKRLLCRSDLTTGRSVGRRDRLENERSQVQTKLVSKIFSGFQFL